MADDEFISLLWSESVRRRVFRPSRADKATAAVLLWARRREAYSLLPPKVFVIWC